MTVICAWCGTVLKAGEGLVSHGICEHCAYQVETSLLRDVARARAPLPRRRRRPTSLAGASLPGFEPATLAF